jgi:uncharacterized RDD family membrane protein YckC
MEQMENLLNDFEEPQYSYVGFWPRFGALFIDGLILIAVSYFIKLPLQELDNDMVVLIVTPIVPLFYHIFLEYKYAATLGKMLLKIKIVNYELQPPTLSNIILRNIIYIGLQFVSFGKDLYNYYKTQSFEFDQFDGISSYFTPMVIAGLLYSAGVFVIYIIELVFLLNDEKHRALHDRIGKTYVVKSIV